MCVRGHAKTLITNTQRIYVRASFAEEARDGAGYVCSNEPRTARIRIYLAQLVTSARAKSEKIDLQSVIVEPRCSLSLSPSLSSTASVCVCAVVAMPCVFSIFHGGRSRALFSLYFYVERSRRGASSSARPFRDNDIRCGSRYYIYRGPSHTALPRSSVNGIARLN